MSVQDSESIQNFNSDISDNKQYGPESILEDDPAIKYLKIKPHAWVIVIYSNKTKEKQYFDEVMSTENHN